MKYIIITTNAIDGTSNTHTVDATSIKAAYDMGARIKLDSETKLESVRVYHDTSTVDGMARAAIAIARTTAKNSVARSGGTETQYIIDRELRIASARMMSAGEHATVEYINGVMSSMGHDAQDFYGYAIEGLQEAQRKGYPVSEQYHAGYIRLNHYVHSQRAATAYELSTEFIIDGGGDVVAIGTAIAQIIKQGDRYTPTPSARLDEASARRLCVTLSAAVNQLTPTQKDIVKQLAKGYSMRQIAERERRTVSTIAEHVANIRKRVAAYVAANAPEFIENKAVQTSIKRAEVEAAQTAIKSKSAAQKATQAERARRYRARKAAERKAAEGK